MATSTIKKGDQLQQSNLRHLRIAWLVVFGTVYVLLIELYGRSYGARDMIKRFILRRFAASPFPWSIESKSDGPNWSSYFRR
jgi:hypothetical protein